jgi:hypothetical protein
MFVSSNRAAEGHIERQLAHLGECDSVIRGQQLNPLRAIMDGTRVKGAESKFDALFSAEGKTLT